MFTRNELILADSYEQIVREAGREDLIFCSTEGIYGLFQKLRLSRKEVTLVSAYSDFGIHVQNEAHPNADIAKTYYMQQWPEINSRRDTYCKVELGPTVNEQFCHPQDKFSVKVYAHTLFTFNEVPECVKRWYCVNLCTDAIPQANCLPFGINEQGHGKDIILNYRKEWKDKVGMLYLNFQNHTVDRINLKRYYSGRATVIENANLDYPTFATQMANHRLIMCPAGNGVDSYRVLEAIYLGSAPVIQNSPFAQNLKKLGLPVLVVDNLFGLTPDVCSDLCDEFESRYDSYNWTAMRLQYWKERICEDLRTIESAS